VFENRVLRTIFGPKREEVTGERSEMLSEELRNFYLSPNINRQMISGRMRLAAQVARMGEKSVQGSGG
jgi:hypothetical protein